jgi:hypothetical protein
LSWKRSYVKWYRIAEEVLAGSIPILDDDEIVKFVSQNNWLIIPTTYERDRKDSIVRSDPNIYFDLSEDGKIHIGFTCNTLESVRRMRNLLHGFHRADKASFISELQKLDDSFKTRVERKIKEHYFMQSPEYETEFEFRTNMINDALLSKAFETIDRIMEESDSLLRHEGKSWRTLAPTIEIAHTVIERDEEKFRRVLKQLKPAYEIALRIKTDKEIDAEILRREKKKKQERQRKFREFIERLKAQGVHGKEWREAVARWNRENPWED